jgi:hypothetical protein
MGHKVIDVLDQFMHRAKRAAADGAVGDESEEALDQVEPRAVSRHEVQMPAGTGRQLCFDLRVLVRRVVIDDQLDVEIRAHRGFDRAQEAERFLMPVPRLALIAAAQMGRTARNARP